METVAPFIAYVIALGIAAFIPGPGVAALVGRALTRDFRDTVPFIFGLAIGDVFFLTVAVLGLSAIGAFASGLFLVVKVGGGLYLLYLAWQFWTTKVEHPHFETVRSFGSSGDVWKAVGSGLAVTLGNPKSVVFYLALLPNVVDLTHIRPTDWLVLSLLTLVTLFGVLLPYAFMASRLRLLLSSARALRRLNRTAAILIGGAGAAILHDAASTPTRYPLKP